MNEPTPAYINQHRYDAFISYRHIERDMAIAKAVHKQLETYRVPNYIKKATGKTRIGKVFRDRDELPLMADLGDGIHKALERSDWLIVICSPDLLKSKWCMAEINYFIALGRRDRILTVLAAGEPEESFPPQLRFTADSDGAMIEREPLAADVRADTLAASLKKVRGEKLRLLAPMLGVGYDDLRRRQRERLLKTVAIISAAATAFFAIFGSFALYQAATISKQNAEINERSNAILTRQSRDLAEKGETLLLQGDISGAALLAFEALPKDLQNPDRPLVAEASALLRSTALYANNSAYKPIAALGHGARAFVLSADGNMLLTYGTGIGAGNYLYNLETLELVASVAGPCTEMAVYDAGNFEYTLKRATKDGDITSTETFQEIYSITHPVFSKDGKRVYINAGLGVMFSCETGEALHTGMLENYHDALDFGIINPVVPRLLNQEQDENGHIIHSLVAFIELPDETPLYTLAFGAPALQTLYSPDGRLCLRQEEENLRLYNLHTGEIIAEIPWEKPDGYIPSYVPSKSFFSPDGKFYLWTQEERVKEEGSASYARWNTAYLLDFEKGEIAASFSTKDDGDIWDDAICFSPDSALLSLGGSDNALGVYNVNTGDIAGPVTVNKRALADVCFDPESRRIAASSTLSRAGGLYGMDVISQGFIYLWDAETLELIDCIDHFRQGVSRLALSPNGDRIVGLNGATCLVWEKRPASDHVEILSTIPYATAFPDHSGRIALWGYGSGHLFKENSITVYSDEGVELCRMEGAGLIKTLAVSSDGSLIAAGYLNTLWVWDAASGKLLWEGKTNESITRIAISANGTRVSTITESLNPAFAKGGYCLFDAQTGEMIAEKLADTGDASDFDSELTKYLYSQDDTAIAILNTETGDELFRINTVSARRYSDANTSTMRASLRPDGKALALCHPKLLTLALYDGDTGETLREHSLDNHTAETVCFSPDGRYLLVAFHGNQGGRMYDGNTFDLLYEIGQQDSNLAFKNPIFTYDSTRFYTRYSGLYDSASGDILLPFGNLSGGPVGTPCAMAADGSIFWMYRYGSDFVGMIERNGYTRYALPNLETLMQSKSTLARQRVLNKSERMLYGID